MLFLQISLAPWRIVGAATAWPVASHQQARRNALVGTTAVARSRRERLDVEDYLAAHTTSPPERLPGDRARHTA